MYTYREAANIPLQQIPYYPPATQQQQQKGRPRKKKPLQSDETIINSNSNIPSELVHENRLGEEQKKILISPKRQWKHDNRLLGGFSRCLWEKKYFAMTENVMLLLL